MIFHLIWIVGVITFIVLCGSEYKRCGFLDGDEVVLKFFIGILASIGAFFVVAVLGLLISGCSEKVYINTFESQIYAKGNQYVIVENQSKTFKVYTDESSANYVVAKQGETQIIDDGNTNLIVSNQFYKSETVKWLIGERTNNPTKYEIHIPKGTILVSENKLDVE